MRAPLLLTCLMTLVAPPAALAVAPTVTLETGLDRSVLLSGRGQLAYLRVALRAVRTGKDTARPRVNLALVVDRGHALGREHADLLRASIDAALSELAPEDVISIVAFDGTVEVLVPATRARERASIDAGLDRLRPGAGSALFAGASKGAAELRKFRAPGTVDRVLLISDGAPSVGPTSPGELRHLGAAMRREGIGITTIGSGASYSEDALAALSAGNGGRHLDVEDPRALAGIVKMGVGGLSAVVAQDIAVSVRFCSQVVPTAILGGEGEVGPNSADFLISQLYDGEVEEVLVAFDMGGLDQNGAVATVEAQYRAVPGGQTTSLNEQVRALVTEDADVAASSVNPAIATSVEEHEALERSRDAVKLSDAGRSADARAMLQSASERLFEQAERFGSKRLATIAAELAADAQTIDAQTWPARRKVIIERQLAPLTHKQLRF